MDWLWERIDAELARRGKPWAWLGRKIDATDQVLANWKARRKVPPGRHREVAAALGWTLDQMLDEDWTPPQHAATGVGMLPVAHSVSHQKREAAPPFTPWEQLLNSPLEAEFQTEAPDASMAPDVPAGARVIFITDAVAEPGDFVLVRDKHGNVYIREFKQVRPGHWQAWAKNRAFLPLDSETDGLEVLAVCDGVRGRMSRRMT